MRRPVFLSFCYDDDCTRVQQIKQMGSIIESQPILNSNDFETIRRSGSNAIKKWIDEQMAYKQCIIVLIGEHTSERSWVMYEIQRGAELKKPMFGIYIHNLEDINGHYSKQGKNPFDAALGVNNYQCYNPIHNNIKGLKAYNYIYQYINYWIDSAIRNCR